MALGYAGHPEWRDMSEYLTHMTRSLGQLTSILSDGRVRSLNRYGAVRRHAQLDGTQRVVCLSEIPVDRLDRLASRRGWFGVALDRRAVMAQGAVPVWYLPKGTEPQKALFDEVKGLAWRNEPDLDHWLWKLTPFIDYPGTYDMGSRQVDYDWTWEREWRLQSDLEFEPAGVAFLFAPGHLHDTVEERWRRLTDLPRPPLIDPSWPIERVQEVAVDSDL
jgi:hypothetical protein